MTAMTGGTRAGPGAARVPSGSRHFTTVIASLIAGSW
jgi:hypothetical protein